jgi:hypothetical protein
MREDPLSFAESGFSARARENRDRAANGSGMDHRRACGKGAQLMCVSTFPGLGAETADDSAVDAA